MNKQSTSKVIAARRLWGLLLLSIMMLNATGNAWAQDAKSNDGIGGSPSISPDKSTLRSTSKSSTGTVTLNGEETCSWDEAMTALIDGDNLIVLQSDVTMENVPTKACTISGNYTLTHSGQLNMEAPIIFNNITLSIGNILAQGHALTFGENVACSQPFNIWAGGGENSNVESTNLTINSGTFGWIYGGSGQNGSVGTAKVTMNGGTVNNCIYGGGWEGTCGSTEVTMTGGTVDRIYGGNANEGSVSGSAKVSISGNAKVFYTVYGGGSNASSSVGNTEVYINTSSTIQHVYGGGENGSITNNTQVTIENGEFETVYGGGKNSNATIGGNVDVIAKGGTMQILGINSTPANITGTINITIEGGKTIFNGSAQITSSETDKDCTLTFLNCGTESTAYNIPTIYSVSKIILKNSYITKSPTGQVNPAFIHNLSTPLIIEGSGMKGSFEVQGSATLAAGTIIVKITDLMPDATFTTNGYSLYKVGKTYRYDSSRPDYKTINITQPDIAIGTLSVTLSDNTELDNGDEVPNGTQLTIAATPVPGKTLVIKNGENILTDGTLTVNADVNLTVEELKALNLSEQTTDITISKEGYIWKYLAAAITRTTPTPVSFNGTVTGTLPEGYSVLIDASSTGTLTFDNVVINATSSGAALIIAQGADITIAGEVEAKTDNTNSPAIQNNGSITAENGASITAINSGDASKGISISEGGSLLLSGGSSLTASGLENAGTVVAKDGATVTNSSGGSGDLLKTYGVTITAPGNGNTLTAKTGDISIVTGDRIAENTIITLVATTAANYMLQKITVTPEGEAGVTVANNSAYKMPAKAISIAASFNYNPPYIPPVYHTVTLPAVEGATTDPMPGSYEVEAWEDFQFFLILDDDYNQSEPIVTTDRAGEAITPHASDGAYIVKYVHRDVRISIDGIVKNPDPVANADLQSGSTILTRDGSILITTDRPQQAQVITLAGQVLHSLNLPAGTTHIDQLADGIYIVRLSEGMTQKVIVRK